MAVFTSGGGCGGRAPRNVSRNDLPRTTGEVRAAADVTVNSAPLPSRPRRMSSSGANGTPRDCETQVFGVDAVEEQLRLPLERVPQVVVEIRKQVHDRLAGLQRAYAQPLPGEVRD